MDGEGERAAEFCGGLADVDYWRSALDPSIAGCRVQELPGGFSPSQIYRIHFTYHGNALGRQSVVCKETAHSWPDSDPRGFEREWCVYHQCLAHLPVVGPELLYSERSARGNRLVLVDLDLEHYFLSSHHVWNAAEINPVLETLARLHVAAEELPLAEVDILMPAPDERWTAREIMEARTSLEGEARFGKQARELHGVVEILLERQAREKEMWKEQPRTLLHSDFNARNVAFQRRGGEAQLIDWHIAAGGMAAFEVASLFYQPHRNHRNLDAGEMLGEYLNCRRRLGGRVEDRAVEWGAFRYAMAGDGLSYLPPIARAARQEGGLAGWWANMFENIRDNLKWCATDAATAIPCL